MQKSISKTANSEAEQQRTGSRKTPSSAMPVIKMQKQETKADDSRR